MGGKPRPPRPETFRKPPRLPKGFKPAGQAEARDQMAEVLKASREAMKAQGIDAHVYVHMNRDGSVDAELFAKEPKYKRHPETKEPWKPHDLFTPLHESLPAKMPGFWVSTGARFEARRDEDNYHRHKAGVYQAQSYYQEFDRIVKTVKGKRTVTGAGNQAAFNVLVGEHIAETIEKRQRKKVDGIFLRLHWNQTNSKPGRADEKRKDRRGKKRKTSRKSPRSKK